MGLLRPLSSTDHRTIALQYAFTALLMLLLGFGIVLLMRWQLAYPDVPVPGAALLFGEKHRFMPGGIVLPDFYNQLAGMHGTIMVFLGVVPLMIGGFGQYLVPGMIGARGMAFPRWSRIGYLFYAAGMIVLLAGFAVHSGPANAGWTGYPPLSVIGRAHTGQTLWLAGLALIYLSSLALCINLLVTIVLCRAPGMTPMRLPFFVWAQGATALLLLLAFPPLAAAACLQLMDRLAGSSFFLPGGLVAGNKLLDAAGGGSALLWQHLFWFLAHPEVYVMLLPAFGIVGEVLSVNARRPLYGYRPMVLATGALLVLSMLVWAHHMYLTGMGAALSSFFQTTTVIISLPSIVIASSLVATLWGGALRFNMPMCFALAFLPMFAVGGLTGLPLAMRATNTVLHDTYYVIGHFHYVVAPGILFAAFAGIYHWFPRVAGRTLGTRLGHLHLWPTLVCMNVIFSGMMLQGINGLSRRLYDGGALYALGREAAWLHVAATHAAFGLILAQLPFLLNLVLTLRSPARTAANPWDATTLEWLDAPPLRVHRAPYEYDWRGGAPAAVPQTEAAP